MMTEPKLRQVTSLDTSKWSNIFDRPKRAHKKFAKRIFAGVEEFWEKLQDKAEETGKTVEIKPVFIEFNKENWEVEFIKPPDPWSVPKLLKRAQAQFLENNITTAAFMAEAWTLHAKTSTFEAQEVVKYIKDGGDIQYWPGAYNSFVVELCVEGFYEVRQYRIEGRNLVEEKEGWRKLQRVHNNNDINSPLLEALGY